MISLLDSQRFGVKTAKAEIDSIEALKYFEHFSEANQIEFGIVRVGSEKIQELQSAIENEFVLMDTLVHYVYSYSNVDKVDFDYLSKGLRLANTSDACDLRNVAASIFKDYSSHYHADNRLNSVDCDAVYADWAYRSCKSDKVADSILLYEDIEGIAGFATLKYLSEEKIAEGPLFGVHLRARGCGVFRLLLRSSKAWGLSRGAMKFHYSTQITNLAVQKVLCNEGFVPIKYEYTLHKWYKNDSF